MKRILIQLIKWARKQGLSNEEIVNLILECLS